MLPRTNSLEVRTTGRAVAATPGEPESVLTGSRPSSKCSASSCRMQTVPAPQNRLRPADS